MSDEEDVKPLSSGVAATQDFLQIEMEFERQKMGFKVKPTTKISKIFNTFCDRKNLQKKALKCFNEDGDRLLLVSFDTASPAISSFKKVILFDFLSCKPKLTEAYFHPFFNCLQ